MNEDYETDIKIEYVEIEISELRRAHDLLKDMSSILSAVSLAGSVTIDSDSRIYSRWGSIENCRRNISGTLAARAKNRKNSDPGRI